MTITMCDCVCRRVCQAISLSSLCSTTVV